MKKDELYQVYEDPLTKTRPEGIATIIRIEDTQTYLEPGYYYCAVKFKPFEPVVLRKIDKRDLIK